MAHKEWDRMRTGIRRRRLSFAQRDLKSISGVERIGVCDRWQRLRGTDLKVVGFPGGEVSQQRQNAQDEDYGATKNHRRRQRKEEEAFLRIHAPYDDIPTTFKDG